MLKPMWELMPQSSRVRAEASRIGDEGDVSRFRVLPEEGGVEVDGGPHDSQAIGADDPHAVGFVDPEDLLLQAPSLRSRFPEAGGNDDEPLHAGPAAGFDDRGNRGGGGRDDGQIDRFRHGAYLGPAGVSQDRLSVRVHGIDFSAARRQYVFQDRTTESPFLLRGADYGDRRRIEELLQISHAISLLWIRERTKKSKRPQDMESTENMFHFNGWNAGLQSLFLIMKLPLSKSPVKLFPIHAMKTTL